MHTCCLWLDIGRQPSWGDSYQGTVLGGEVSEVKDALPVTILALRCRGRAHGDFGNGGMTCSNSESLEPWIVGVSGFGFEPILWYPAPAKRNLEKPGHCPRPSWSPHYFLSSEAICISTLACHPASKTDTVAHHFHHGVGTLQKRDT